MIGGVVRRLSAGRWLALIGGLVWLGVLGALVAPVPLLPIAAALVVAGALALGLRIGRRLAVVLALLVLVALGFGWRERQWEMAAAEVPVEAGEVSEVLHIVTGPRQGAYGYWALAGVGDTRRILRFDASAPSFFPGDVVRVVGALGDDRGRVMGRGFSGVIDVEDGKVLTRTRLHTLAISIRGRVADTVEPQRSPSRALLAGFLIGDTDRIPMGDVDLLRRSGLSHFVAVSGSNVAVFLGLVFVIAGPLGWAPRRRAVLGLAAVVVFVVVTQFEPSVIRAGTMAGLVLGGRLVGIPLDGFGSLGVAVACSVLVAPGLGDDVGFALSVLATAGVLAASEVARDRGWRGITTAAAITIGAQVAVAPLLVTVFGSVPLAAPLANIVAAPLVTVATTMGAIGTITGLGPVMVVAATLADLVLGVASVTAGMGDLGPIAVAALLVMSIVWWRRPRLRRQVIIGMAGIGLAMLVGSLPIRGPVMVALDVGQGDAILVVGRQGETMLVDGGPDEELILERLRDHGISQIDLVVASHVHADHVTGLSAVVETHPVGRVWLPTPPHTTPTYQRFLETVAATGVPTERPIAGSTMMLGTLELEVLGPRRRYSSPNDQSIVIAVRSGETDLLLTGDVEVFAQDELAGLTADILKVPHQGAATSDPGWLASIGADVAVISVGPNDFGHPSAEVVAVLRSAGAEVRRTDLEGDVMIPLGSGESGSGR